MHKIDLYHHYYPFGSIMSGCGFNAGTGAVGFNGMEKDDEVKGSGNSYDFGFRIYDSRLSRFLSVDPVTSQLPWSSPYSFAENDVIRCMDFEGLERALVITMGPDVKYRGRLLNTYTDDQVKHITNIPITDKAVSAFATYLAYATDNSETGSIDFLTVYGHGSLSGDRIYGSGGYSNGIKVKDLKTVKEFVKSGGIKFSKDAVIYLGNCMTASICTDNSCSGLAFAQELAYATGATVIAGEGGTGPKSAQDELDGQLKAYNKQFYMFSPDPNIAPIKLGTEIEVVALYKKVIRTANIPEKVEPRRITEIPMPEANKELKTLSPSTQTTTDESKSRKRKTKRK